jgi:hypothetical protein
MHLKVALLLLLVFASTITATAIAFSIQTPVSFGTLRSMVSSSDSWVEPLGDPIDSPGVPN